MELRHLLYFVKVAELQSFCEASRELNISQSTLSQQIRQLEGELGVNLLVRNSHHVRLSDVGEAFLPQALRTISAAKTCLNKIRDVQELGTGELNIGSTYTFLPLLKEAVLLFMKQYPGVKMNICCHSMETLLRMVKEERIDMALSYRPLSVFPEIESHILFDNRLTVVVSEMHPLASFEQVNLHDLCKYPLALPTKGMQARNHFERIIEGGSYDFNIKLQINEVNLLVDIVRSSKSLASVLSEAALLHTPGIKSVILNQQGTLMEGSFHILRNGYMKRATKEFLRILCENRSYGLAMMNLF